MTDSRTHVHRMTRVDIFTGVGFDDFITAFETAAPRYDPVPMQRIVESGGTWEDVAPKSPRTRPTN